jgi:hypothetical protein
VQNNGTTMGDNVNESNQLFAVADPTGLRVGVTGNVNGDGSAIALFIDSVPGGQGVLDVSTQPSPPAALPPLNGTAFEPGFEPDFLLLVEPLPGSRSTPTGSRSNRSARRAKRFLGSSTVGSGSGELVNGEGSLGILAALDNRNGEGVTDAFANNAADRSARARDPRPVGSTAAASSRIGAASSASRSLLTFPWGEVGNQVLPPLPAASGNAGFAPDFAQIAGVQTALVQRGPASDIALPYGVLDLADIGAFVGAFGSQTPEADLAPPIGVFDLSDISTFVGGFLNGCP